jgi:hypothetical protein
MVNHGEEGVALAFWVHSLLRAVNQFIAFLWHLVYRAR